MASLRVFAALLLSIPALAGAQETITIPRIVPYAEGVGTPDLRNECDWNKQISDYIVTYSKRAVASADDLSAVQGPVLWLTITNVHAAGGGNFSGPKWGTVTGELKKDGQTVGSFTGMRQVSQSGLSFTACGVLGRVSKSLGKDIAKWLENPTMDARLGNAR